MNKRTLLFIGAGVAAWFLYDQVKTLPLLNTLDTAIYNHANSVS